jgi:hypothetical protein
MQRNIISLLGFFFSYKVGITGGAGAGLAGARGRPPGGGGGRGRRGTPGRCGRGRGRAHGRGRGGSLGRGARDAHDQGKKKGGGGREREGKGRGKTHLRGSKFLRSRLQTLGHHGERERWKEREVTAWEKSTEPNGSGGGGTQREGRGARDARAGPGWAGLGHIADRNPRQARPLNGLQSRTEIRDRTRRTRDIRQRIALRHDATPMTLRFCLYMTRTPVTILV